MTALRGALRGCSSQLRYNLPMQVIGSGFGRTGTLSLKSALETLGFGRCYHMMEVIRRPGHVKVWVAAANGQPVNWQQLFTGFEAAVDYPSSIYYREMMQAFPDAKVLHSVRDPQRWYDSTLATIYRVDKLSAWAIRWLPFIGPMFRMTNNVIWDGLFQGRFEDREFAVKFFDEYTAEVKRVVPADRLLVFDVNQGWEPLCDFLDVPIPDTPFPHRNDRASMQRMLAALRALPWLVPAGILALLVWFIAA